MNIINLIKFKKKYFINFNFILGDEIIIELINDKKSKSFSGIFLYKNINNLNFKILRIFNNYSFKKTIYISKNLLKINFYKRKKNKKLILYKKIFKF